MKKKGKSSDPVQIYEKATQQLISFFNLSELIPIKLLLQSNFQISVNEDCSILQYQEGNIKKSCVLLKNEYGNDRISKGKYCLCIGIECIKKAFIFNIMNENKENKTGLLEHDRIKNKIEG